MQRLPLPDLAYLVCENCNTVRGDVSVVVNNGVVIPEKPVTVDSGCCGVPLSVGPLLTDKHLEMVAQNRLRSLNAIRGIQKIRASLIPIHREGLHLCIHIDFGSMWIGYERVVDEDDKEIHLRICLLGLVVHFAWDMKPSAA